MKMIRQLTVNQMARRALRYVPELDFMHVCNYLRSYGYCGLLETDVQGWVQFFDRLVIDERSFEPNGKQNNYLQ